MSPAVEALAGDISLHLPFRHARLDLAEDRAQSNNERDKTLTGFSNLSVSRHTESNVVFDTTRIFDFGFASFDLKCLRTRKQTSDPIELPNDCSGKHRAEKLRIAGAESF